MERLITFFTDWDLEDVVRSADVDDHIPTWDQDKQRAFVIYALCCFPLNAVVLREVKGKGKGKQRYTVVDGRERIFALRSFLEGKLILEEHHFKGSVLEPCLGDFEDRQWAQDGFEDLGIERGGIFPRTSRGGSVGGSWRVNILRNGSEEHDQYIRSALNVRSEPVSPELLLRACCTYLESVVSGTSRKSFLPLPTTENSVASYQFNPSPGVYGANLFLFVRDGAVFFNETSRPIEGLLDFKTKLRHYYPGAQFE